MSKNTLRICLAYILIALLTFGYCYNFRESDWEKISVKNKDRLCEIKPALASIFWPMYWGGKISIYTTKKIPELFNQNQSMCDNCKCNQQEFYLVGDGDQNDN